LFYNAVEPVNVTQHGKMKVRQLLKMGHVAKTHAMPVTVDEFALCQRHYPIVFSIGDKPIPIALMGLNEASTSSSTTTAARSIRASTSRPTSAAIRSCSRASTRRATSCRCASTDVGSGRRVRGRADVVRG
jgi:hypothetical protein